ncbi:MAG: hypothetical protein NVS3B26_16430 [Mycobacteriales bacterium]
MVAIGIASSDPEQVVGPVLACWDAFIELAAAADLDRPSRLPGWSGRDVCIHLGSWPEHRVLEALVRSARESRSAEPQHESPHDADATNAALIAAHRSAPNGAVLEALQAARDEVVEFFGGTLAAELGRRPALSPLGPLPMVTLLHAASYELAVHALDLVPCGGGPVPEHLLHRGLAALVDVTGALAARTQVELTLTAQTSTGGWRFASHRGGWTTEAVPAGRFDGTGVRGSAADLLDTSAGRANLGSLLITRRLQVQQLPSFMRLAPLLHEVPGLPGGAALRTAVAGLGGVTKVLGRFRRG